MTYLRTSGNTFNVINFFSCIHSTVDNILLDIGIMDFVLSIRACSGVLLFEKQYSKFVVTITKKCLFLLCTGNINSKTTFCKYKSM